MVFIRPTILRDNVQASFETNAKYNYIRDIQLALKPENPRLMPLTPRSTLPELGLPPAMPPAGSPDQPVIDLRLPPQAPAP
jgi:type II secretory pathway component GspD/PulD (secretin)